MHDLAGRENADQLFGFAAGGFRDFTRIAASDPKVWRDIFLGNRDELLRQSRALVVQLQALEVLVADGQGAALEEAIAKASSSRSQWRMNTSD